MSQKSRQSPLDFNVHPKQLKALYTPANEILFGGARGGGKSHIARIACVLYCTQIPNFQAYLFRRLLPDLIKNHMEGPKGFRAMLQPWVKDGLVQIVEDQIRFLWNNSRIHLCHCQEENDVYKYLGSEIHLLALEEATQFNEMMYRMLKGSCRCIGLDFPEQFKGMFPRVLNTSNPGGEGHGFFKEQFIDPAPPETIFEAEGWKRIYIPSRLDDNPSISHDDPTYKERLKGIGSPELVRAYLEGDWNAILGAFLPELKLQRHAVKPFEIPKHWTRFMSYDWGSYDPFSIGWWAVASEPKDVSNTFGDTVTIQRDAIVRYREWYGAEGNRGLKLSIETIANNILRKEGGEDIAYRVMSRDAFRQRGGPSIAEEFAQLGLIFRRADDQRKPGWVKLRNMLIGNEVGPYLLAFDTCRDFFRILPTAQHDPHDGEDMDGANDHLAEEVRYSCTSRFFASQASEEPEEARGITKMTYNELVAKEEAWKNRRVRR